MIVLAVALLLAVSYALFGVHESTPLLLNVLSSVFVLAAAYLLLGHYRLKRRNTFLVLLAVIFFTPLPPLVLTGIEHCLQIALTLLAAFFFLIFPSGGLSPLRP